MFDLNWAELLIIGFVALIVIGPEDLPDMFRQLGRFTAKLRQMSREFSRAMEEAAKQSGMKEAADDLKAATSAKSLGLDAVRGAADKFEKWDPIKNAAKAAAPMPARSLVPPPMPATPAPAVADAVADDAGEAADDLAFHDFEGADAGHGPATQELYDKQALRARVLAEQTEKLKAIEAGTYAPAKAAPHVVQSAPPPVTVPAAPTVPTDLATLGMNRSLSALGDAGTDTPAKPALRKRTTKAKADEPTPEPVAAVADATKPESGKKTSRKTASKADKT